MRRLALLATVVLACAGGRAYPPLPRGLDAPAARATLERFARALEAARWDDAVALLSSRWRGAYTPARLAADFAGAGPAGREAAGRVLAALSTGAALRTEAGRVTLAVAPGRAAVLVAEAGTWRVDALE